MLPHAVLAPRRVSSPPPLLLTILLLALLPAPATAATHWLCGLSEDSTRLVCVAETDMVAAADAAPAATLAVVRGTAFPLHPATVYTVNFWSPATELDRVEHLARATICYRSPDCEVTMTAPGLAPAVMRAGAWRVAWR